MTNEIGWSALTRGTPFTPLPNLPNPGPSKASAHSRVFSPTEYLYRQVLSPRVIFHEQPSRLVWYFHTRNYFPNHPHDALRTTILLDSLAEPRLDTLYRLKLQLHDRPKIIAASRLLLLINMLIQKGLRFHRDNADIEKLTKFFDVHNPFTKAPNILSITLGVVGDDFMNC